jgi:hypothetical protein
VKLTTLALLIIVAATGCGRGARPPATASAASDELTSLANSGAKVTYAATYRYTTSGLLTPGLSTRMQIVQRPPTSVRKLETSTAAASGRAITVRSWQATDQNGSYSCTEYPAIGVRCLANALPPATFQSAQLDEFFDTPRHPGTFGSVARASGRARIAGLVASCFETQSAQNSAERLQYELCYSSDGILLRGRRTIAGPVPSGADTRHEAVVEAVSVTHNVVSADIRLPGPITDPRSLRS